MNIIQYLFAGGAVLILIWAGIATYIIAQDWQLRRKWRLEDERAAWREKVEAMRRVHDQFLDERGDA